MIKDEVISVRATSKNKSYYENLGYDFSNGMTIDISSLHLQEGSSLFVTRICEGCSDEKIVKRYKAGILCKQCSSNELAELARSKTDPTKTTCKSCGGKKSYRANMCSNCVDKSGDSNGMYGRKNPQLTERNKLISENPELHWNWKGGKSMSRSGKQIAWAKGVKERFNWVCDCCGYDRKISLEAHHLVPESFDVKDGVSLCCNCHKEFHKTYGYGENTPEQYFKFKGGYYANA